MKDKQVDIDWVHQATSLVNSFEAPADLADLVEDLGQADIVMLGESTHGTHEFYALRALITKELIKNHGFRILSVEGDFPAAQKLDDFIHGRDPLSADPLRGFQRWPTWMWMNTEVAKLSQWLRVYNERNEDPVSFYGLDVYSLFESIDETLKYVKEIDPFLAATVKSRYECFSPFQRDERIYAKSLIPYPEGCADEVASILTDLLNVHLTEDQGPRRRQIFNAVQNARIVANAEDYYRVMVHGGDDSWNVRDRHMLETLDALIEHHGPNAKTIVWAHNTHIGDHRATDMMEQGHVNIGGLAREKYGDENIRLVGFGTFKGEVLAGHAWGGPVTTMRIPAGKPGSLEDLMHLTAQAVGSPTLIFQLRDAPNIFRRQLDHRAIGVVYNPQTERFGNYVPTHFSDRYDAFVFCDQTSALVPLRQVTNRQEMPETYPSGL